MAKFDDIYDQLKHLARRELAKHGRQTMNTTALVHEAFIKLAHSEQTLDRAHRINLVAQVMRQITLDHARAKLSQKRAGSAIALEHVTTLDHPVNADSFDMIAFDQALSELAEQHPRMARVLELAFFSGVENEEIAEMLEINLRTVQRDLLAAKTLLRSQL